MKKLLIIIFTIFHYFGYSQINSINEISGVWSVQEIKNLIPGTYTESDDEYNERLSSIQKCIGSEVEISKSHITFKEKKCNFFNCTDFQEKIYSLKVINNTDSKFSDDDIEKHYWIDKTSINLMDKNYSAKTIKCIFTDCPTGFGDYRAKIFLFSTTKIVIFQYYNLIVLKKII